MSTRVHGWPRAWAAQALAAPADRALTAMAAALLGTWLLALIAPVGFAPERTAEWIMAHTPPDAANLVLDRLGGYARPAALLGGYASYLLLALLCAAPRAALGRRRLPVTAREALPLLLTAAVWGALVALWGLPARDNALLLGGFAALWLLPLVAAPPRARASNSRRAFLQSAGVTAGAVLLSANAVLAGALVRLARGGRSEGEPLFAWSPPAARVPGFDLPGLPAEVTPVPAFYTMSKNVVDPRLDMGGWSLRVHGLVREPFSLSYTDLLSLPRHDLYVTLRCISNRVDGTLMSTALFSGVLLRDLLERAGLDPAAQTAVFRAPDGHADSVDLGRALAQSTLIAYALNGRTLTRAHGFPARLLVPGLYGFKHVKWLTDVEMQAGEFTGHWQELGWTRSARVKTVARIDTLARDAHGWRAAGVAFSGDRGISAVELRVDEGAWQPATLNAPSLSALTWVQWRAFVPAGARTVSVRALDAAGRAQEESERAQFPDGAQGLHRRTLSR